MGVGTNHYDEEQAPQVPKPTFTSATVESTANHPAPPEPENGYTAKEHEDDTGEVVLEDKEDTVIY